jgi:pimeloyl-ACP methyl ester carboxylesterase
MPAPSPIVFVHGLFGPFKDPATFAHLAPAPCSAPDLLGYGAARDERVTLDGQVEALRVHVRGEAGGAPVHLVGHSVGAVYAFVLADRDPGLVASVTTVEGNFTLADAFWSASIATMDDDEARASIEGRLTDPHGFLAGDGVAATAPYVERAAEALAYQPWRTVRDSARAIVAATSGPEYEDVLRRVFSRVPVHLVAGERTAGAWDVPDWARTAASSTSTVGGAGHMVMLEHPERFGEVLATALHAPAA